MELTINWEHSQGNESISNVVYFEVQNDGQSGDTLYCEFEDGHAETFTDAVIGGGTTE